MVALKNLHIFLKEVSPDKRQTFIKYIVGTLGEERKQDWRLKLVLAQNLGNYAELFDAKTVYNDFLPMFLKFCSDSVSRVGQSCCPALAEIVEKFNDDETRQQGIVRVIRNRYAKARTYKKRQLFVLMCTGKLMMKKALFEKYFKLDLLTLVNDRVPNVRILLAKALRHHFLKEISGEFVFDADVNDAVTVLKQDPCDEVRFHVTDIETYAGAENQNITLDEFM